MHGNRDFLLGSDFASLAGWTILPEPRVIQCGDIPVLLAHGDGYCTSDTGHQWFRRLTRNRLFCAIFKHIPLKLRMQLVGAVRNRRYTKSAEQMDVVQEAFIADMQAHNTTYLVHGHTHKQHLHEYDINGKIFKRFVLSDWDDSPAILCYDRASGFYFDHSVV
jgi:UDP-2,3-diacylglucosamine hydrolase